MMRGWVLLVATVLMVVPGALAAQGTLTGRSELPIQVDGTHQATAADSRVLLEGQSGTASLLLQGVDGTATRVIHRAFGYVNSQDPKAEVLWDDAVETKALDLHGSLVSLDARLPDFRALAYDGQAFFSSGAGAAPLLVGALDSPKTVDYALDRAVSLHLNPPSQADRFSQVIPAGTFQARADDGRAVLDGPFKLFVTDAQLTYRGADGGLQDIPAHFRIETAAGSLYNPASKTWFGPGSHPEYVQEYLLVDAASGHLELQFAGLPGSLYAAQPSIAVDGTAHLPALDGTVTVTEDGKQTRHDVHGSDLDLAGPYTLLLHDAIANPARTQVEGSGDITQLTYAA